MADKGISRRRQEGSARLSSCRRLSGAGLRPHAWSGLLSLGAPTPRRHLPASSAAEARRAAPSVASPQESRDGTSSASSGPAGCGGGDDGTRRGTRAFGMRTLSVLEQRSRCQAVAAQAQGASPTLLRAPRPRRHLGQEFEWRIPWFNPVYFIDRDRNSLFKVTQLELGSDSHQTINSGRAAISLHGFQLRPHVIGQGPQKMLDRVGRLAPRIRRFPLPKARHPSCFCL
ncbi:uncharacterized protein LOC131384404 [Hylobates moloch]|uniref:uncharacterized protein LOC131384404 n=1 Tax=Hylobates moloch TaxID=81572 RepID=UPI002674805C|nr:uncharacterized protein LOC131384404 [Hylobates moloch]